MFHSVVPSWLLRTFCELPYHHYYKVTSLCMVYGGTIFNLPPAFVARSSRVFKLFDLHFSKQPQWSALGHNQGHEV